MEHDFSHMISIQARPPAGFFLGKDLSQELAGGIATAATKASTVTSYVAAGLNVWLGLSVNEWSMLIGALCAVGTFLVNLYYRRREDKRADARMRQEKAGSPA